VLVAYEDLNMALRATSVMALIAREAGNAWWNEIGARFQQTNTKLAKRNY
jgi:hypothetical protein